MDSFYQKSDVIGRRLGEFAVARPWLVLVSALLLSALLASGMRFLSISTDYKAFFSKENPDLTAFEHFQSEYTQNDNILVVIKIPEGKIFSPQIAAAVEELTTKAWTIPHVLRVDSVTNFQHSWSEDDDIIVDDLVRDAARMTPEQLAQKEAAAHREPLLENNLLSADGSTTGINIVLQFPNESIMEIPTAVNATRAIVAELQESYPDLEFAISGIAMLNNAFSEASQSDMATLVPLMYLIIVLVTMVALRSWSASIASLLVITLSTLCAMGVAGFSRIGMTPISFIAPTIIMTVAIADAIHILVSMVNHYREGHGKKESIVEAIRVNFLPVSITSLTTLIGFLSLNFSDSPPFWHLGNITAAGIVAAWLLSLTLLPALVALLPLSAKAQNAGAARLPVLLDRVALFVIANSRKVLLLSCAATLVLAWQVPKLELNDDFVRYFDEDIQFRTDSEFAIDNLNGIYLVEYSLGSGAASGINSPAYLENLESFTLWLREQPEVRHVFSYSDIIKRLNKNMYGDDEAYYRLPDNSAMAAQLLFMYENSLPAGTNLSDRITTDKSATRVTVAIDDMTAKEGIAFFQRSEAWIRNNLPEPMWTKPTSVSVMFSYISQRNIQGMLKGNALAVILISLVLILSLRHVGLGLLSIIPNALPILATYGLWSLLVGQVGMAAAAVSATSLGIIVDDTTHFLMKYLRGRREKKLERPEAIRYAFRTVGVAVVVTTVILTLGFSSLVFSSFLINSHMGLLTMLSIIIALLLDLLMLPALLLVGYKKLEEKLYEPAYPSQAS